MLAPLAPLQDQSHRNGTILRHARLAPSPCQGSRRTTGSRAHVHARLHHRCRARHFTRRDARHSGLSPSRFRPADGTRGRLRSWTASAAAPLAKAASSRTLCGPQMVILSVCNEKYFRFTSSLTNAAPDPAHFLPQSPPILCQTPLASIAVSVHSFPSSFGGIGYVGAPRTWQFSPFAPAFFEISMTLHSHFLSPTPPISRQTPLASI